MNERIFDQQAVVGAVCDIYDEHLALRRTTEKINKLRESNKISREEWHCLSLLISAELNRRNNIKKVQGENVTE